MLTTKGWIHLGVVIAFLAQTCGLIVQGGQLQRERAEVVRLKTDLRAATARADDAEKKVRTAEALGATQAQETAILCQGEGAELFARGRQVGVAIGRSQCPVS